MRVCGVGAKMCTWEVVTGFGTGELSREILEDYFRRDFPDVESMPVFWKMVSFNAAEGRHHRYLVVQKTNGSPKGHVRTLPGSISLFALADREMRTSGALGNYRFAAMAGDCLYVLVFYEGRLCHWSEEYGYGGDSALNFAARRLERFDAFLQEDSLFSQGEGFIKSPLRVLESDFRNLAGNGLADFKRALRDPFWKGLHLEPKSPKKQMAWSIILLLTLMVAGFSMWNGLESENEVLVGPEAPALSLPPQSRPVVKSRPKGFVSRNYTPAPDFDCLKPSLEIRGLVGNRLFSGVVGGEKVVKKAGDSLGVFLVKSVLRDRVVLECGGREWEVLNGRAP